MTRRIVHWLAWVVVALVVAISHPAAAQGPYANVTEKQVNDYLQAFLTMALWISGKEPEMIGEERAGEVHKHYPAVRARIVGDPSFVLPKLKEITSAAGIELVILSPGDGSESLLIEHKDDIFNRGQPTKGGCDTFIDRNAQGGGRFHLLIDPFSERRCFVHELGHGLGFYHAHDYDSVMSYTYRRTDVTPLDVLMLRVLYDRRLKPGMRFLPAMVAARAALVEKLIEGGAPPRTADMGWAFVQNLVPFLTNMAEKGNLSAQMQLGFAYTRGEVPELVPKDDATGHRWFERAVRTGDADAQANVGYDLLHGRGVTANPAEGIRLLRVAADQGHAGAQAELGMAYTFGRGMERDEAAGHRLFVRAAAGDDVRAQANLGYDLLYGRGVAKNPAEGIRWLRIAADRGHAGAQYELGIAYKYGRGVTADPLEAIRWLRLAADQAYAAAQYEIGDAYTFGKGVAKDEAAGYGWFRRAAEAGQVNAQSAVGYALLHGRGVAADPAEGIRWLRTAAGRNLPAAQDFLGTAYRDGLGVTRDPVEAYKWFALAAARKFDRAQKNLDQLAPTLTAAQIAEAKGRAEAWGPGRDPAPL